MDFEDGVRGDLSELDGATYREAEDFAEPEMRTVKYIEAVALAAKRPIETDERVIIMGEDIHRLRGGVVGAVTGPVPVTGNRGNSGVGRHGLETPILRPEANPRNHLNVHPERSVLPDERPLYGPRTQGFDAARPLSCRNCLDSPGVNGR